MKHKQLILLLTLTVIMLTSVVDVMAQRYSFNKWDRLVFRNNPPLGKRIYSLTEFNLGYGARYLDQPYEIRRSGVTTLLAYRYSRTIAIGVGAGLESYNGGTLAPLFLEGQIYFDKSIRGSIKPFLSGSSGYLAQVSGIKSNITVFANPSAGLLIPITYRSSLTVSLGVFTQWNVGVERYSFLDTKIGVLFY